MLSEKLFCRFLSVFCHSAARKSSHAIRYKCQIEACEVCVHVHARLWSNHAPPVRVRVCGAECLQVVWSNVDVVKVNDTCNQHGWRQTAWHTNHRCLSIRILNVSSALGTDLGLVHVHSWWPWFPCMKICWMLIHFAFALSSNLYKHTAHLQLCIFRRSSGPCQPPHLCNLQKKNPAG